MEIPIIALIVGIFILYGIAKGYEDYEESESALKATLVGVGYAVGGLSWLILKVFIWAFMVALAGFYLLLRAIL